MLFKEKLLLSNCDSVKKLTMEEVRKRFLTGMVFSDGVVLSPNILIDNLNMQEIISKRNIVKYLNEEGYGKLIIRGFNISSELSLMDYFEKLPDNYIISSIAGSPEKSKISKFQHDEIITKIKLTQKSLNNIGYISEGLNIPKESLRDEALKRISDNGSVGRFFENNEERSQFIELVKDKYSRSEWYKISDAYFENKKNINGSSFKAEIIDPSYNSLFANKGEGFLQDDIKLIHDIPEMILDANIMIKSMQNEKKLITYPMKAFEIISTLGSGEIIKYITDEAIGYIEDKLSAKGESYLSRKNWFGMYDLMKKNIGLEIK